MFESVCFLNQTQTDLESKAHSVISTKIAEDSTSVLMDFQPVGLVIIINVLNQII